MHGAALRRHEASPAVLRWLESHAVEHEVHRHPCAMTAAAAARADGVSIRAFVKVLGVETEEAVRALMVLDAEDRLDLARAAGALGSSSVRLLSEAEIERIDPLDEVGTLAPIGSLYGLPVIVDPAIRDVPFIAFAAGSHEVAVHADRAGWESGAAVIYRPIAADRTAAWLAGSG